MIFFQATEAGPDFSAGLETFYLELEELEQSEARKEEETKDFKKRKLDILERLTVAAEALLSVQTPNKVSWSLPVGQELYVVPDAWTIPITKSCTMCTWNY